MDSTPLMMPPAQEVAKRLGSESATPTITLDFSTSENDNIREYCKENVIYESESNNFYEDNSKSSNSDNSVTKSFSPTLIEHAFKVVKSLFSPDKNRGKTFHLLNSKSCQPSASESPCTSIYCPNKTECSYEPEAENFSCSLSPESACKGATPSFSHKRVMSNSLHLEAPYSADDSLLTTVSLIEESFQSTITHLDQKEDTLKTKLNSSNGIFNNSQTLDNLDISKNSEICGVLGIESSISQISSPPITSNTTLRILDNKQYCPDDVSPVKCSFENVSSDPEVCDNSEKSNSTLTYNSGIIVNEIAKEVEANHTNSNEINNIEEGNHIDALESTFFNKHYERYQDSDKTSETDSVESGLKSITLSPAKDQVDGLGNDFIEMDNLNDEIFSNVEGSDSENTVDSNISTTTVVLSETEFGLRDTLEEINNASGTGSHFVERKKLQGKKSPKTDSSHLKSLNNTVKIFEKSGRLKKKVYKSEKNINHAGKANNNKKLNKSIDAINRTNLNSFDKEKKSKRQSYNNNFNAAINECSAVEIINGQEKFSKKKKSPKNLSDSCERSEKNTFSLSINDESDVMTKNCSVLPSQQSYTVLNTIDDLKRPIIGSVNDNDDNSDVPSGKDLDIRKTSSDVTHDNFDVSTKIETSSSSSHQTKSLLIEKKSEEPFSQGDSPYDGSQEEVLADFRTEKKSENFNFELDNAHCGNLIEKDPIELSSVVAYCEETLPLTLSSENVQTNSFNSATMVVKSNECNVQSPIQQEDEKEDKSLANSNHDESNNLDCINKGKILSPNNLNKTYDLNSQLPNSNEFNLMLEESEKKSNNLKEEVNENKKIECEKFYQNHNTEKSNTAFDNGPEVSENSTPTSKDSLNSSFLSITSANISLLHDYNEKDKSKEENILNLSDNNNLMEGYLVSSIENEIWVDTKSKPSLSGDSTENDNVFDSKRSDSVSNEKFQCDPDLMQLIKEQFSPKDIEKVCSVVEELSTRKIFNSQPITDDHIFKKPFEFFVNNKGKEDCSEKEDEKTTNVLSPHSFDFLGSIEGRPTEKDLNRISLYVKFDPLLQTSCAFNLIDFTKEAESLTESETVMNNKPIIYENGIERMLSLSPQKPQDNIVPPLTPLSSKKKNNLLQGDTEKLQELQNQIYFLKHIYAERERANKEKIDQFEKNITKLTGEKCILEQNFKESNEREKSLSKRIQEQNKNIEQIVTVMEEYLKLIGKLTSELETEKEENAKQISLVKAESDSYATHLQNTEAAFTDVHAKYEKSKKTISNLKANESMYKNTIAEQLKMVKIYEEKCRDAEEKARKEIEKLNDELNETKTNHIQEVTRMKALLRKTELKAEAVQEKLEQKIKENERLAAICDDLIEGKNWKEQKD